MDSSQFLVLVIKNSLPGAPFLCAWFAKELFDAMLLSLLPCGKEANRLHTCIPRRSFHTRKSEGRIFEVKRSSMMQWLESKNLITSNQPKHQYSSHVMPTNKAMKAGGVEQKQNIKPFRHLTKRFNFSSICKIKKVEHFKNFDLFYKFQPNSFL